MPSIPPPLPHSPSCLTPWRISLPNRSSEPSRINWSAILASVSVSCTLVAGILAWIATHPHKTAPPPQSPSVAVIEPPAAPPPPPPAPAISKTPAFHHLHPKEVIACNTLLLEENPPPLPPPSPRPKPHGGNNAEWAAPWQLPPPKPPAGQTYGTQVLFLNNREAVAEAAHNEHKLLFVMHISGNFEDSCFT